MASDGRPLQFPSTFASVGAAITIVAADDPAEIARRHARVDKKRGRNRAMSLSEEPDACGWSSAVVERSLALRRRRGAASCSRRGGWVVCTADDEQRCRLEQAAASEGAVAEEALPDSGVAFLSSAY